MRNQSIPSGSRAAPACSPAEVGPHCTGRRLRSATATSCSSWLTTGWWPKLLHARETSSGRRLPPSSRRAEARVKPGDAAAALESCCTFSSCSVVPSISIYTKHKLSTDHFLFIFAFAFLLSFHIILFSVISEIHRYFVGSSIKLVFL